MTFLQMFGRGKNVEKKTMSLETLQKANLKKTGNMQGKSISSKVLKSAGILLGLLNGTLGFDTI